MSWPSACLAFSFVSIDRDWWELPCRTSSTPSRRVPPMERRRPIRSGLSAGGIGGKCKLQAYVGGGGFGEVYAGFNVNLPEQRLIIKYFKRVQAKEKFNKEARILCLLDHHHPVRPAQGGERPAGGAEYPRSDGSNPGRRQPSRGVSRRRPGRRRQRWPRRRQRHLLLPPAVWGLHPKPQDGTVKIDSNTTPVWDTWRVTPATCRNKAVPLVIHTRTLRYAFIRFALDIKGRIR